jgi:SOS-response transcriptional repressor LexA
MASRVGQQLKALRERSGLSVRKTAAMLEMQPTSYAYYEDGFKGEAIPVSLAKSLRGVMSGKGQPPIVDADILALAGMSDVQRPAPAPIPATVPKDVPVLGTAVGGNGGDFSLNGQVIDYVRRPTGIAMNRNVFAIYIRGDSMHPRFDEGDLLYVDPNRPAKVGDDVLVELQPPRGGEPGHAYVKQLAGKSGSRITLRQFNPFREDITVPIDKVLRISPILKMADLLGF